MRHARLFATAALCFPSLALAWTHSAGFETTVHGHEFHKVQIEGKDCRLKYRFDFTAPAERYRGADAKLPRYRFAGRIKLKSGSVVMTPIFPNAAPGERKYENTFDTSGEGCWAKDAQQLAGFDVKGCRGQNCTPDGFNY
jgi:hypothetical protein